MLAGVRTTLIIAHAAIGVIGAVGAVGGSRGFVSWEGKLILDALSVRRYPVSPASVICLESVILRGRIIVCVGGYSGRGGVVRVLRQSGVVAVVGCVRGGLCVGSLSLWRMMSAVLSVRIGAEWSWCCWVAYRGAVGGDIDPSL